MTGKQQQSGFTYLSLLFMVAITGVWLGQTGVWWSQQQQRELEQELLFVGHQYRQAIERYYQQTPSAAKQYPPSLEHLLIDNRFNPPRHHLRRPYRDPFTRQYNWRLIQAPEGGIMGIASQSAKRPLKRHQFKETEPEFEQARSYQQWEFSYRPANTNTTSEAIPPQRPTRF